MKKLFCLLVGLSALLGCVEHPPADLIFYNGLIYPVDSSFSTAQAMAIKDGKVLATGSSDSIRRLFRAPQSVDLEGKVVYPGFNDAHAHFYGYAQGLLQVNLMGTQSFAEVLQRTKTFAEVQQPEFIEGRGWDQNDWEVKEYPTKTALDSLFPETPVLLKRVDGHAALANQAALDYAGVKPDTIVGGGSILKKNGELTGILIDNAVDLVRFPETSEDEIKQALLWAQDSLLKHGITSLTDAGLNLREINHLKVLQDSGDLNLRINAMVSDHDSLLDHFLREGKIKTERLKVQCFKFYLDGALGSRGALMLEPYSDDQKNHGLMLSQKEHFEEAAQKLKEAGWQMAVHAIGDSANRLALDIYDQVLDEGDLRWRIEHAQIVHPSDIERFGELGVIPSVQPTHATSDMYWAEDRLGKSRMPEAYPYQDLLNSVEILPLGTDFPVEDIDPRKTFLAAVFRQDTAGYPQGGFRPSQRLSAQNTLRGMTTWPAYASFEEDEKGSLQPGKYADFIILEDDLMDAPLKEILQIKVLQTYINGEPVYQR